MHYLLPGQRVEYDGLVDAVQELGPEGLLQRVVDRLFQPFLLSIRRLACCIESHALAAQVARPQVAGHDDDCVPEIHRPTVAVGQPAILQDLQQDVEHVRVGLLNFVEENHPVGTAAHRLGQLAALVVAHVARGSAHQPGHGVLLHVLRHVQPDHIRLVVEQELRQGLGQLRLAHARRAKENETADGPAGVAQSRPGPANGLGHGFDRLFLPDQPLVQQALHLYQAVRLALQQPAGGNARPAGHQVGDIPLPYPQIHVSVLPQLLPFGPEVLLQAHALRAQLGRLLVLASLGRGLLSVGQEPDTLLQLVAAFRHALGVDAHLAGRLVNEVNGLVRQLPAGYAPVAEPGGSIQGSVVDLDFVVGLIAGPQGPQDFHRVLDAGFLQVHGLEPPLQGRILLDMLAVLVQGGGANALQFPSRQGRLQQVAGV